MPTRKVSRDHYLRERKAGKRPKRIIVAVDLFNFIISDYTTIAMTLILLVTLWRTLNTIEILQLYYRQRKTEDDNERDFLDQVIKDKSLQKKISKEFLELL